MTRKCVLCKETNYRNTYSFFSAPKDPETRKKWQDAISIENYSVTDDTFVCSKHFHKDDIITHWVSGVPPHVITIKYKKCRLRPGAVPDCQYHYDENAPAQEVSDNLVVCRDNYLSEKLDQPQYIKVKHRDFLIPRREERIQATNDKNYNASPLRRPCTYNFNNSDYSPTRTSLKMDLLENTLNSSPKESNDKESRKQNINEACKDNKTDSTEHSTISNRNSIEDTKSKDKGDKQVQTFRKDPYCDTEQDNLESSSKKCNLSKNNEITASRPKILRTETIKTKPADNNLKATEDVQVENGIIKNLYYNRLDTYYVACDEIGEDELLFEDLLEVCTEVLLPRGWSCLVTSKGPTTTIVYLYMGMTKSGMPFTEKQVYIKSDMILHCTAVNREINPFIHNLIKEGKHLKVQSLLDIEELIDDFDQRTVCQGIYNTEGFQKINPVRIVYKDGIKWRHILCPLILNNDSARCTKCISLSPTLQCESINLPELSHDPSILTKNQQRIQSICQKRTRPDDKYEFMKTYKY